MDKWINLIRSRDEAVYVRLIEKYSRLMWKLAWDVLKDTADAANIEDCISEVFYKLWKSPELFDPEKGSLKNYLARMTRNTAIDFYRKRSHEKTEALRDTGCAGGRDDDVLNTIIRNEEKKTLRRIMEALNERDKELLNRRYFKNQKPAQMSMEMQLPLREVENRLYRIKERIRKQFGKEVD